MSDLNEQGMAEELPRISVGEVLRTAREEKNLDIDDICSYLRLSHRQVLALEGDDYAVLPEATITRGFIRNYARMLELDAEPLLETYRSLSASGQPRPISIQSENIRIPGNDQRPWLIYIFASVLIVLLVAAWVIYVDYIPKPSSEVEYVPSETEVEATVAVQEVAPLQPAEPLLLPADAVTEDLTAPADSAAEVGTPAATESAPETSVAAPSVASAGQAVIKLKSSDRSWVSITDKNNRNIFDKIMVAGIEESVQGLPPFQVVIGNAPSTTLTFNNKLVDLLPVTKDRVARLTLE
ncbi:MAG: hypothetical protein CVU35_05945 [Betaproteobacteria bacterium HGW-Betaproteobacteria-8]|nr:MAG: hypothetical protein CVU35_05945 [Betaproteobacteria bacterium HGW-Betaproteobacteria-8]